MKIAEIFLRGDEVYDIKPNPDLDLYSENAGKDIFSEIAGELKEES
jgi:hypothetical protein